MLDDTGKPISVTPAEGETPDIESDDFDLQVEIDLDELLEESFKCCFPDKAKISISNLVQDVKGECFYFVIDYPHHLEEEARELEEVLEEAPYYLMTDRQFESLTVYVPPSFELDERFAMALVAHLDETLVSLAPCEGEG